MSKRFLISISLAASLLLLATSVQGHRAALDDDEVLAASDLTGSQPIDDLKLQGEGLTDSDKEYIEIP